MSLRRRFVLALAAYGLGLAAVMGSLAWRTSKGALEEELNRRLIDVAGAAAAVGLPYDMALNLRPGDEDDYFYTVLAAQLDALVPRFVDRAVIFTVDAPWRLLVDTDREPIGTELSIMLPFVDEVIAAQESGSAVTRLITLPDGRPYKWGFVRLEPGQPAILGVFAPVDFFDPVGRLRAALLWGSAAAVVVAVMLGGLLAASIVGPLEKLSRVALRIQRGHLDRAVEVASTIDGEDEVGRLARAMERMRVAIIQRDERLRLMLAQVAHEIRNPLGGLELFASEAASTDDPRERRRLIDRVRGEVAALNRIIDDFLTFARPLDLEYEPIDVRGAVEDAADLARAELLGTSGLEVRLPVEPLMARADPDQIKRAVLNLLRNAAQAGERVRVWAEQEGGEVMIAVIDDGPGVAAEVRDRVFDPFVTDKEKGAGLGLSIVKKVADAHGGRVELRRASDPEFGSGAEFRLYLTGSAETPALVARASVA